MLFGPKVVNGIFYIFKGLVDCKFFFFFFLYFYNVFFPAAQTCALLSTFVCDEKSNEMPKLGDELSGPLRQMQEMARRIAKVVQECKLEVSNFKVMGTFEKLFSVLKFFVCRHVSMWGFRNRACPYLEKRNHPIFVNISLTLMIDTWIEKYSDSSRVLQHENPKNFFSKMVEFEFLNCAEVLPRKEITLSLSILVLR